MHLPSSESGFRIAILCASIEEKNAVEVLLLRDRKAQDSRYAKHTEDTNIYSYGILSGQPVVLACLQEIETQNVSKVARMMRFSFPALILAIRVGIMAGAPSRNDSSQTGVRLGDVIISTPSLSDDFEKQHESRLIRKSSQSCHSIIGQERVEYFLQYCRAGEPWERLQQAVNVDLSERGFGEQYQNPGRTADHIYALDHVYKHRELEAHETCARCTHGDGFSCSDVREMDSANPGCEPGEHVGGQDRGSVRILFDLYVSNNTEVKSASRRDHLARDHDALAVEMEDPGTWDALPTMIVRGVASYADCQKHQVWRLYSAARAALCTAAIIDEMDVLEEQTATVSKKIPFQDKSIQGFIDELYKNTTNYDDQKSRYDQRAQHSCQWIQEEYHQVWDFVRGVGNDLLCITGIAGCGKSHIAAWMTRRLQEESDLVCHYFFNPGGDKPDSGVRVLCALLHQICRKQQECANAAYEIYRNREACLTDLDTLWNMLLAASNKGAMQNVIVCIDALDQCERNSMAHLLRLISMATSNASTEQPSRKCSLRVLITCQPNPEIIAALDEASHTKSRLELSGSVVSKDRDAIASFQVQKLEEKVGHSLVFMKDLLTKRTDTTFLWMQAVCSMLSNMLDCSETEAKRVIEEHSSDLNELYSRMLNTDARYAPLTKTILQIVMAATEALTLDELNVAVSIKAENTKLSQVVVNADFERLLQFLCGGLLTVSHDKRVSFSHQTVVDFLRDGAGLAGARFDLCLDQAQQTLAQSCMAYLLMDDLLDTLRASSASFVESRRLNDIAEIIDSVDDKDHVRRGSLLFYAASHWHEHLAVSVRDQNPSLWQRSRLAAEQLLSPDVFPFWRGISSNIKTTEILIWAVKQDNTLLTKLLLKSNLSWAMGLSATGSVVALCAGWSSFGILRALIGWEDCPAAILSESSISAALRIVVKRKDCTAYRILVELWMTRYSHPSPVQIRDFLLAALLYPYSDEIMSQQALNWDSEWISSGLKMSMSKCSRNEFKSPMGANGLEINYSELNQQRRDIISEIVAVANKHALLSKTVDPLHEHKLLTEQCLVCLAAEKNDHESLESMNAFDMPIDALAIDAALISGHEALSCRMIDALNHNHQSLAYRLLHRCLRTATITAQLRAMTLLLEMLDKDTTEFNSRAAQVGELPRSNKRFDLLTSPVFQEWVQEGLRHAVSNSSTSHLSPDYYNLLEYLACDDGSLLALLLVARHAGEAARLLETRRTDYERQSMRYPLLGAWLHQYMGPGVRNVRIVLHPDDRASMKDIVRANSWLGSTGLLKRIVQQALARIWVGSADLHADQDQQSMPLLTTVPEKATSLASLAVSETGPLFANLLKCATLNETHQSKAKDTLSDSCLPGYREVLAPVTSKETGMTEYLARRLLQVPTSPPTDSDTRDIDTFYDSQFVLDSADLETVTEWVLNNCEVGLALTRGKIHTNLWKVPKSISVFIISDHKLRSEFSASPVCRKFTNAPHGHVWNLSGAGIYAEEMTLPAPGDIVLPKDLRRKLSQARSDKLSALTSHHRCLDLLLQAQWSRPSSSDIVLRARAQRPPRVPINPLSLALLRQEKETARHLIAHSNADAWRDPFNAETSQSSLLQQAVALDLQDDLIGWLGRNQQNVLRPDRHGATIVHYIAEHQAKSEDISKLEDLHLRPAHILSQDTQGLKPRDYAFNVTRGDNVVVRYLTDLELLYEEHMLFANDDPTTENMSDVDNQSLASWHSSEFEE